MGSLFVRILWRPTSVVRAAAAEGEGIVPH